MLSTIDAEMMKIYGIGNVSAQIPPKNNPIGSANFMNIEEVPATRPSK